MVVKGYKLDAEELWVYIAGGAPSSGELELHLKVEE